MQSPSLSFLSLSDDDAKALLSKYSIGLTPQEARDMEKEVGRPLTLTEAVIFGIQGSEHCSYKSSRSLLKGLPTDSKYVILGPKEDAGIIAITDGNDGKRWGIVIGHESHNHPSQIVPYEGAATGIGGCVRDVLCMGARVIGCMDALRFGDLKTQESRTIAKEVVRGIAGYGNPLGIPNLGGDIVCDSCYNSNCLVNAITVGLIREDEIIHSYVPEEAGTVGYDIILIGKATDRSGFGGAAFASATMEEEKREQNSGAVQEPNPFLERHLLASTYELFDELARDGLLEKVSFKDLGAGGVVCASVEQVSPRGYGAEVDIDKVHVSMEGLPPEVIACAETQERFCWICHPDLTDRIVQHYNERWDLPSVAEHAKASVIGKVNTSGRYVLRYNGDVICDATAKCITSGLLYDRPIAPKEITVTEPVITCDGDTVTMDGTQQSIRDIVYAMLRDPNNGSKQAAFVHYDKNIIGNTVLEPGEADAGVIAPLQDLASYIHEGTRPGWDDAGKDAWTGVALAVDGNGRYGRISPYLQGMNAVAEAMRNVAAVGAIPRALTDCLNYGNPEKPTQLWELSEGIRGIADAANGVQIEENPVAIVSGNVSLYNSTPDGNAIDPTAIVSCVGVMKDARKAVTMQLKSSHSSIYLLGAPNDECGGSEYYKVLNVLGANVPSPDLTLLRQQILLLSSAVDQGLLAACHDVSEGGLALALLEMTLPQRKKGGAIGLHIDVDALSSELRSDTLLFAETGTFLCEVSDEHSDTFEKYAASHDVPCTKIGTTTEQSSITITRNETTLLNETLEELHQAFFGALDSAWSV